METNKILNADYLDILFDGKNKKYGGYELRKKYPKRALIAGIISILVVGGVFASTLINLKKSDDAIIADVPVVTEMQDLEQPPPLKENEPPPPPPPEAPPPVKPTVKFTVPEIKKDAEVPKEEKMIEVKKEEKAVVGVETKEGSDDPNALDPGLSNLPSGTGKAEPVRAGTGDGNGPSKTEIFRSVEKMPKPPFDVNQYLSQNMKYPIAARENEIQGRVYVSFVVERDGSISNVSISRGKELGGGIPEEAMRVVKAMPKWQPGEQNGQAVRCYFTVPVNFKLQ